MKLRFLDWKKNATATMNAINVISADKTIKAAELQIATGARQLAVRDGVRANRYQTNQ